MEKIEIKGRIGVSLRPYERKFLAEYCKSRGFSPTTVLHDIFTLAMNGDLITKMGKNYFHTLD